MATATVHIKFPGVGIIRKVTENSYELTVVPDGSEPSLAPLTPAERRLALELLPGTALTGSGRCLMSGGLQFDVASGYLVDCVPAPCSCGCYISGMEVDSSGKLRTGGDMLTGRPELGARMELQALPVGDALGTGCGCG